QDISRPLMIETANKVENKVTNLKKLYHETYKTAATNDEDKGDEPDEEAWEAFAPLLEKSFELTPLDWDDDNHGRLMRELYRMQQGVIERVHEIYDVVIEIRKLRQTFGWDNIIFGELWLIRPDEREIPQDKSNE
ncbi:MAG: hypothetical protein KDE51_18985, partial [Anaerolineales bacterium]|nr:hypothetical protein [Anaerolineales bacterium]